MAAKATTAAHPRRCPNNGDQRPMIHALTASTMEAGSQELGSEEDDACIDRIRCMSDQRL